MCSLLQVRVLNLAILFSKVKSAIFHKGLKESIGSRERNFECCNQKEGIRHMKIETENGFMFADCFVVDIS